MTKTTTSPAASRSLRIQQLVKWSVYSLLLINFGLYIVEDITQATHTLHAGSTMLDWSSAFATSLAVLAWFMMLASLELETYAIDDDAWTKKLELLTHGVRIVAFLIIAHFIFALVDWAVELESDRAYPEGTTLCDLADDNLSWSYNLDYVELDEGNCASLPQSVNLHQLGDDPVVTDDAGLKLSRKLAWGDVLEIFAWMIIIICMDVMVRLQSKGVTESRLMTTLRITKITFYGVLFCLGFWWASLGHWLYLWDTFLWIAGFGAIEMNMRLWREEIRAQRANTPADTESVSPETPNTGNSQ